MVGPTVNNDGETELTEAIKKEDFDQIRTLIRQDLDFNQKNAKGESPAWLAKQNYKLSNLYVYLRDQKDADIDTPLTKAIKNENLPEIAKLLKDGCNCEEENLDEKYPLELAKECKNINILKTLVLNGNFKNKSKLMNFILDNCSVDILEALLEKGEDPNTKLGYNKTNPLLSYTLKNNKYDMSKVLIEGGADVNVLDSYNNNPLMIAIKQSAPNEILIPLIKQTKEFNVNKQKYDEPLVIHLCKEGNFEALKILLEQEGINPDILSQDNQTALHIVLNDTYQHDSLAFINLLIEKGANIYLEDSMGRTAYEHGCKSNNIEISSLFKKINIVSEDEKKKQLDGREKSIHNAYHKGIEDMSLRVFLGQETTAPQKRTLMDKISIIANYEGYESLAEASRATIQGGKLEIEIEGKTYPIGYSIFMPPDLNPSNKIVVHAYGGMTTVTAKSYPRDKIFQQALPLLESGHPCINLHLPDLLQDSHQAQMSPELHNIIHQCINEFYNTITTKPNDLSPELEKLNLTEAELYLIGGSFGGRTAIRHAQLFPGTFSGYISHDGALTHLFEEGRAKFDERPGCDNRETLYPSFHVKDIKEPILILQNRDDNNVSIHNAIDFYQKLVDEGKEDLARLVIFEKGNPIPDSGKINKGHFVPENNFKHYSETLIGFIEKGVSIVPEVHKSSFLKYKHLKHYIIAPDNIEKRFLGLATNLYIHSSKPSIQKNDNHNTAFSNSFSKQDKSKWNEIWNEQYKPIAHALIAIDQFRVDKPSLEKQILRFKDEKTLTDDVIINTLKRHSDRFREYYKEHTGFKEISQEEIFNNPLIINEFRELILNLPSILNKDFQYFLLEELLLSNPKMLPVLENSTAVKQELTKQEKHFRSQFEMTLVESKFTKRQAWTTAARMALANSKKDTTTPSPKVSHPSRPPSKK